MTAPLVSVVTPTWQRHDLLLGRCVPSVLAQTYPHVEHIVVSDGPDQVLADRMAVEAPHVRFEQLDTWDRGYRWGTRARLRGIDLAKGELIAYLDDDNAFRPEHLQVLAGALERAGADFAYGRMRVHADGGWYELGVGTPMYGQVDTSMLVHRPELLARETWRNSLPTIDWDLVERWVRAGADWAWVPDVTVDYYR